MTTTFERRANGEIIYRPDDTLDIPNVDVMTLLFGKLIEAYLDNAN